MSEFVDECRREWRRLGVPDPIAIEMAADLTVDLEEAETEGGSPEDVLGNSAFDPRRFAASWAAARGVTGVAAPERASWLREPIRIACIALLGALVVGAGLVLMVGRSSSSIAFATRQIIGGRGQIHAIPMGPRRLTLPGPLGRFLAPQVSVVPIHLVALLLLVGVVGGLGLLFVLWSRRSGARRFRRRKGGRTPSWN